MDYQRMSMGALQHRARQDAEGYDDEATRVYVQRLIDLAGERRYSAWDFRPGWPALSPTALAGEAPGGGGRSEQMVEAVRKGWRDNPWYAHAATACARLPRRNEMALMIQWLKADSRLQGPTAATYDQIAAAPGAWLQRLGWAPAGPAGHTFDCIDDRGPVRTRKAHKVAAFRSGQAIKKAAHQGRVELLALAKIGLV